MRWFGRERFTLLLVGVACATAAQASTIIASLNQVASVPEPGAMLLVGPVLLLAGHRLRKTS